LEQPLTEIIDIKGMKAQGNRLSFHTVKTVSLLTPDEDLSERDKKKTATETEGDSPTNTTAAAEDAQTEDKKEDDIKLEITNPDDIQIDDNGQMEMF